MPKRNSIAAAAALLLLGVAVRAESPADAEAWARVRKLVSGVDLRVTADGQRPVIVELDEVRDDALIVIQKNRQTSFARAVIEKIELRMPDAKSGTSVRANSSFPQMTNGQVNKTTTAGVTIGSREGDYVLVYRRADPPSKR